MSEFIKKRVVKDLIDELADFNSVSLELVGHKVIETLESKALVHHGINKDYKPVGYTVTFFQDFTIVGEYSTEFGYFKDCSGKKKENRFDKIEKDINHSIKKGGTKPPSKIYLVSPEEEPAYFAGNFNKSRVSEENRRRVTFLDARELAKAIFQSSLDNSQAADFSKPMFVTGQEDSFVLPTVWWRSSERPLFWLAPVVCPRAAEHRTLISNIKPKTKHPRKSKVNEGQRDLFS